ncbi:MAG: addiction module protein [Desulfohalobiaceae bacterium]|nr:addiction module protein [Desulfohalobiaceae bacterium]
MTMKEIEAEIKKLDLKDRSALAKLIVESLDELTESEVEKLWAEEAERRLDEMEQGQVTEISAVDVIRRARDRRRFCGGFPAA